MITITIATALHHPHHDGSSLYVSTDQPHLGQTVTVRLRVPHASAVDAVHVRVTPDGEQQFVRAVVDQRTPTETWWRAAIECRNPVTSYRFLLQGGRVGYGWVNGNGLHLRDVTDAADFRLVTFPPPPTWAQDAVVYQIFPDRFAKAHQRPAPEWGVPAAWDDPIDTHPDAVGRQWYGGDLPGILSRLDYLQDLGVTVLYLTPVFPARSNHRYDAATFDRVDPALGGDQALDELVNEGHRRGLRVLGDLTTNHTGDTHEWFVRARTDTTSVERGFYFFHDDGGYETWLGVSTLPKLNFTSHELRRRFFDPATGVVTGMVKDGGLDGWRIDVANMTGRLRDQDLNAEVARHTRDALTQAAPDALLVAEHAHDYTTDARGDGWHGVMNYAGFTKPVWSWLRDEQHAPSFLGAPLRVPRLDASAVAATMRDFAAHVPWRTVVTSFNLLGSHDTTRIHTVVGGDHAKAEIAAALLFTLPGIPMLTYGDEIGMEGEFGEDGRRPFPWTGEEDTHPLRQVYGALIELRRKSAALRTGGLRWVHAEGDALVYLRETADERILVHCARDAHDPLVIDATELQADDGQLLYGAAPHLAHSQLTISAGGPQVGITRLL